jgi:hypothetical protein
MCAWGTSVGLFWSWERSMSLLYFVLWRKWGQLEYWIKLVWLRYKVGCFRGISWWEESSGVVERMAYVPCFNRVMTGSLLYLKGVSYGYTISQAVLVRCFWKEHLFRSQVNLGLKRVVNIICNLRGIFWGLKQSFMLPGIYSNAKRV